MQSDNSKASGLAQIRLAYSSMFTSLHGQVRSAAVLEEKPSDTRSENALNLSLSGLRDFSKRDEAGALGLGYEVVLRFVVGVSIRGSSGTITQNKT